MLMIDVCSGLGGASEAFLKAGWDVIRVDINPDFHPDIVADVLTWRYTGKRPDFVWCSPPCTEFARESMPWCAIGKVPDVSLMLACREIIRLADPIYWVIENVKGAVPYFSSYLGCPRYVCNPFYLWGWFPDISHVRVVGGKEKVTVGSKNRAAVRAKIPLGLSEGLRVSVEGQGLLW
jgi:hypothetical protein